VAGISGPYSERAISSALTDNRSVRIVFFEFVQHLGGARRSTVEFAERLSHHAEVCVVDPYGGCEPFTQAVLKARLNYHILMPERKARIVGGQGQPLRRLLGLAQAMPDLYLCRRRLAEIILRLQPSLISCNNFKSAFVVGTIAALRRAPLMMHMRGWYTPDMLAPYNRWLCRRRCAALLAVSRATKAALMCSGIDAAKIHVLHNPVAVDALLERSCRPLVNLPPHADSPVRLLVPAALMSSKGQHTAIAALRKVLDAGIDAVLWLAGPHSSPYGKDKDYPGALCSLAKELGVAGRVAVLGQREDIPQLLAAATTVVLPTHTEGHPRALLEAFALAKPVAATPVGGIQDMIVPGLTGLFFDVEDAEGCAACIEALVRDPIGAKRIGRNAQEYVRLAFTPEQQTQQALAIFRRIVSSVSIPPVAPRVESEGGEP